MAKEVRGSDPLRCDCGGIAEHKHDKNGEELPWVRCRDCGEEWYVNHCWNWECHRTPIDGRKHEWCPKCEMYHCPRCGRCSAFCSEWKTRLLSPAPASK